MKNKMASKFILVVFLLSFLAPFTPISIAAEKPKPQQQENNDELFDVKTGVKVVTGQASNLVGFTDLMLSIGDGSATKSSIALNSFLITAGVGKVVSDGVGDGSESKIVKFSGYLGDTGELIGKTADAAMITSESYSKLSTTSTVIATRNPFSKLMQTTKAAYTNFKGGLTTFKNFGVKQGISSTMGGLKTHLSGISTFNKVLAPLAAIGAVIDFSEAISYSKDPEKDKFDISEKILSGISNVLVVGALLAGATAAAPFLAVGALVTGGIALVIKYREKLGLTKAAKYLRGKAFALGNQAKDAWKSGISKAKALGSKAKAAINKGISKAKAFGAKAGSAIKKTAGKAYQFFKTKAGQAKKGLSKAAKTISSATKKAWAKTQSAVSKAKKSITSAVKKTFSKGAKAFSNAKKTISAAVKKTYSKAKKTITSAAKKVAGKAKSAISKVTKPFETAKKAVSKAKKTITAAAKKATKKAHSYTKKVTKSVSSASKKAYSYAKKATSTVKKAASKPVSYAKKAVTSAKAKAKSTYSYAKKAASTVKKNVSKSVSSYGKKVSSAVKYTASKSYSYVKKSASSAKKAVKSVASSAKKKASSVAKGVTSFFKKPKFRW